MGAATAQQLVIPAKTVEYYDVAGTKLPSTEGADHRVETTYRDTVAGMHRVYYASGQVQVVIPYAHVRRRIIHGPKTTWYASGQLHKKEDYWSNKRDGELLVYYPDGKVRRRDIFVKGERTEGACFGPDGQAVPYFEYYQLPVYSRGTGTMEAVTEDLTRKGMYPKGVRPLQMDALILVAFTIDKQGAVQHVRALEPKPGTTYPPTVAEAFQLLQKEAVWMVQHLKSFTPAKVDGSPVAVNYTLPVTFRVK